MPYVTNKGVRIHYQLEGNGPSLVLQHGFSSSIEVWYERGYVDALKGDYRLILIDARGHGRSDKPHDSAAYDISLNVADIVAVLDQLRVRKAHFFGYSMGGRIGFAIAKYAPQRFYSLVIGGMHPFRRDPEERSQFIQLLLKGMAAVLAAQEAQGAVMTPEQKTRALANDHLALAASTMATRDHPGLAEVLPSMAMPCLLFAGEADAFYQSARECAQRMPKATFVSLPGLDHAQAMERKDLVLPHVTAFLKAVNKVSTPA